MEQSSLPPWLNAFTGDLEANTDDAAILATVDGEGWPHQAYLSVGEILAHSGGLSIALWPRSRTTANLLDCGKATLYVAAEGCVWEVRLDLHRRATPTADLALFDGKILQADRHAAPYAEVLSLLHFKIFDKIDTVARWKRQIELLRG